MMIFLCKVLLGAILLAIDISAVPITSSSPIVTVLNGTFLGNPSPEWNQEHFLGIPYAQPPVGPLRFVLPQSLNTSFSGVQNAINYGPACLQASTYPVSEDCLNLNVIRPAGTQPRDKLPVLVWIYGGGFEFGYTAEQAFNLSGITLLGQSINKPIITGQAAHVTHQKKSPQKCLTYFHRLTLAPVSLNYRVGVLGFLQTPEILKEGNSNAGLLDQHMAFRWIKENIEFFGGDPDRITIWGESAGAQSIAYHLHSLNGRNDGLYHGAILESGGIIGTSVQNLPFYANQFENFTRTFDCFSGSGADQLACLRTLTADQLVNTEFTEVWAPYTDGVFLTAYPSDLEKKGNFVHIPLIHGANTDEGTTFASQGIDNDTALFQDLLTFNRLGMSPPTARTLMQLYPNDPFNEPPFEITNGSIFPALGLQWRRSAAIGGDIFMHAGRRRMAEVYTSRSLPVYSYRFDTLPFGASPQRGVSHGTNVIFSFQNNTGALGPLPQFASALELAQNIGKAYISFCYDQNPNTNRGNSTLPFWPQYDLDNPQNMVLNATSGPFLEPDTYRKEGIAFLNSPEVIRELLA